MYGSFFRYVWRHSRREQLVVLTFVVGSLPFYWWSLDVPKRIVNEAIQGNAFNGKTEAEIFSMSLSLPDFLGGYSYTITDGLALAQLPYLYALCLLFLFLTLVNGWFKYVINIRKGILGERMLRRLRFELFSLVMRFRPEDIRTTKASEVTAMVNEEVEPIGGFAGDAFITPAFLGLQAATAMIFIIVQNVWLGLVAFAVIAVQGFVIPRLRREQIRLGRMRQLESRKLAGRLGEMVDAAPALHTYGIIGHAAAEVSKRLGTVFDIRLKLYRRKFAVKYLNNLLAQLTPFVFYLLGGYLALNGRLDIGQLVAVISAYRDLPGPIKDLIDWDQQRADVIVKYEQVVEQFTKDMLLQPEPEEVPEPPAADTPITTVALRVVSGRGVVQLDRMSATLNRPSHIALVGPPGTGRDILAKVLGRQITDYQGTVSIGDRDLAAMSDREASSFIVYASSDPHAMSGSIRENLQLALRRSKPAEESDGDDPTALYWREEARKSGNLSVSPAADWIDYAAAGINGPQDLDGALIRALRIVNGYDEIFRVGIASQLGDVDDDLKTRIKDVRQVLLKRLEETGLASVIERFEPDTYNSNATIGENLLFGVAIGDRFKQENLAEDRFVRQILSAEALTDPLTDIGLRILETVIDVFTGMSADNPLRESYSFIDENEIDDLWRIAQSTWRRGQRRKLPARVRDRLIGYALMYIEPRNRLNLIDEKLAQRLLRARASFRDYLPADAVGEIEFYDPNNLMPAASIRDNLLFGRIRSGKAHARSKLIGEMVEVLKENDLEGFVVSKGLDQEVGPAGRLMTPSQRATIQLTRAMLRRPDILILDGALASFPPSEVRSILKNIREAMSGKTLIVTMSDDDDFRDFDTVLTFEGAKLISTRGGGASGTPQPKEVEGVPQEAAQ